MTHRPTETKFMVPTLFESFKKRSRFFYLYLIILGVVNTALNMGILAFISNITSVDRLPIFYFYGWMIFVGLVTVSLIINKSFQTYLVKLTNNILFNIETDLLERLREATYESYQNLGSQRVFTAMGDIRVVGRLPHHFVSAFNATIILLCCLVYMYMISPSGMLVVVSLVIVLAIFYTIRNISIAKSLNELRSLMNEYFRYLNDLLLGFKEIKMSTKRNNTLYHDHLKKNRSDSRDLAVSTSIKYLDNDLVGSYSWYAVIGVILFVLPKFLLMDMGQMLTMLFVILYMMGPIAILTSMVQVYTNSKIAIERLNQFEKEVDLRLTEVDKSEDQQIRPATFESLCFEGVTFRYQDRQSSQFQFGPLHLKINQGETLFITGGNGSGKSTFVNLLTGLYAPQSGSVYLNDRKIEGHNFAQYVNTISAVFTNHYLFHENYDNFYLSPSNEELMNFVEWMQMDGVLQIDENRNKINTKLSKGQQKRLSLIYALLENRDILVLDEWAAEQDPEFRAYFYQTLLPKLKDMGKTIIVITHDDAYYATAERIIKFDYGKVVVDTTTQEFEVSQMDHRSALGRQ